MENRFVVFVDQAQDGRVRPGHVDAVQGERIGHRSKIYYRTSSSQLFLEMSPPVRRRRRKNRSWTYELVAHNITIRVLYELLSLSALIPPSAGGNLVQLGGEIVLVGPRVFVGRRPLAGEVNRCLCACARCCRFCRRRCRRCRRRYCRRRCHCPCCSWWSRARSRCLEWLPKRDRSRTNDHTQK